MNLYIGIKRTLERFTGTQIYRRSTPWGMDLSNDLRRLGLLDSIRTVFDVGANIGQTALRFAQAFPKATIYSFEPVLSTYQRLCHNVMHLGQVRTFRKALGSQTEDREIQLAHDSQLSSFRDLGRFNHLLTGATETVAVSTVDSICCDENVVEIDFLKVDTEGHDLEVLQGAQAMLDQGRIGMIFAETVLSATDGKVPISEMTMYLELYGFVCVGFYDQAWVSPPRLHYCNALFCRNDLLGAI